MVSAINDVILFDKRKFTLLGIDKERRSAVSAGGPFSLYKAGELMIKSKLTKNKKAPTYNLAKLIWHPDLRRKLLSVETWRQCW